MQDSQVIGRVGAQREAKLRVMQFSRRSALDAKPVERKLSRKDLLDEINAQQRGSQPPSPARQASLSANIIRPRDVRKVDPAFATRLEPAVMVRSGCIIVSLGQSLGYSAIVTTDELYCVMPNVQHQHATTSVEQLLSALQLNLSGLRAAAEADGAAAALAAREREYGCFASPQQIRLTAGGSRG